MRHLPQDEPPRPGLVQRRGWRAVRVFEVGASAYKRAHVKALGELYGGARRGGHGCARLGICRLNRWNFQNPLSRQWAPMNLLVCGQMVDCLVYF